MEPLLILTNVPDQATAEKLAQALIDNRAAACVNVLAPCRSIYRWQGRMETATEIPLLIKSTVANFPLVVEIVRARHPYDVPELIALPITHGLPAYFNWLATETDQDE
jgi:periplasmic divalent cation tolerance protein